MLKPVLPITMRVYACPGHFCAVPRRPSLGVSGGGTGIDSAAGTRRATCMAGALSDGGEASEPIKVIAHAIEQMEVVAVKCVSVPEI
jgi:hypothetical protein